MSRLADRSLLRLAEDSTGSARYDLLDGVRAYALTRLDETDLTTDVRRAHATVMANAAAVARDELKGPHQARHLAVARLERSNIDAALSWAADHDPVLGLQIANGFGWAWVMQGEGAAGARRLRAALDHADEAEPAERAVALSLLGWLEAAGDVERARRETEDAIAIADGLGDDALAAACRIAMAFVLTNLGPRRETMEFLNDWRARYPAMGGSWEDATSWILTAHAALFLGDPVLARTACEHAQQLIDPIGDDWGRDHLESVLGSLAQAEHRYDDAVVHLSSAADAARRLGFPATHAFHLSHLGRAYQQAGDDTAAAATLERAIELGHATGDLRVASLASVRLGRVLRGTGERDTARRALERADRWYQTAGGGDGALLATCLLAAMDAEDGAPGAQDRLSAVIDDARAVGDVETTVLAIDATARALAQAGDLDEAHRTLRTADELMHTAVHRLTDGDRIDAEAARSHLQDTGMSPSA